MKFQKMMFVSAICALISFSFTACDKDDDIDNGGNTDIPTEVGGVYFLNSGNNESNNSTLDYYNPLTKELKTKVFASVNGRGLGDTANDMVIYGSKMYIAVTNSNTIEVTDLNAKSLKTITPQDEASPRHLIAYDGKVYVTLFDGHLAVIDTTSLEITKQIKVGPNPEEVCAANGKLYVANSGGYNTVQDSTLSVVDAATLTVDGTLKVVINPSLVKADTQGYLYVMSLGNYGDIKGSVQRLDPKTGKLDIICTNEKISMTMVNDKLYILSSESNASTGWSAANTKYIKYDTKTAKIETENFITDGTTISKISFINVDPIEYNIYMTAGSYTSTGDMFIYSSEGKKVNQIGVSGINPMGAFFVVK